MVLRHVERGSIPHGEAFVRQRSLRFVDWNAYPYGCESNCTITRPELLFYEFNESGSSVTNQALTPPTNTATATFMGAVAQGGTSNGVCGGALLGSGLSSSTDYLNTGWATALPAGGWTISFFTKGIGASSTLYYIFGDVNAGGFRCFTNGVAGANNWILRGTGITDVSVPGAAIAALTMTTFVYDPVLANIKAYLNGVLVNTVNQGTISNTGVGPFKVGGYSSSTGFPVGGSMDDFRFYSRALSATDVANLYTWSQNCPMTP